MIFDVENFNGSAEQSAKVFIPNKSGHDFSGSAKYGLPEYVTKGIVDRFAVQQQARFWMRSLMRSTKEDYILVSSLTILTCVGCAIYGWIHGRINLLLFRNNKYLSRTVIFSQLYQSMTEKEALNEH
jgi:membrane protein YqaA with SNARE-associated domain